MVAQTITRDQFIDFDGQVHSNSKLDAFGTTECKSFRNRIIDQFPLLSSRIRAEYLQLSKAKSYVAANLQLLKRDSQLRIKDLNLECDYSELEIFCKEQSESCEKFRAALVSPEEVFEQCSARAQEYGLVCPDPQNFGNKLEPCINRLCCTKWWKRQVTKIQRNTLESVARELRLVHKSSGIYCSNISLQRHQAQKKSNREFLESQVAVNEFDQEFTLSELSELTVSNPRIRRTELITRCKGFELVAKELGHKAVFLTLTTPSRFHKMTFGKYSQKVIPNKNYENLSPGDAQKYLRSVWSKINSKLKRENIRPYGFRVAEPHHDGTPHWHFLLFIEPQHQSELISIFRRWSLKDSPDEEGAKEHRFKVEKIKSGINPKSGQPYSATGYLIKYICKNIDGHGVDNNETSAKNQDWKDLNPHELAERIEAWARTHRIRQFQQIGGPSVTVWREMRRLGEQDGVIEKIREAADSGDWAAFVNVMGGPNCTRQSQPAHPAYAKSERLDRATGEISKVTQTLYGDEAKDRVVGVLIAGITVLSRTHFWEIKENEKLRSARQKIMHGIADLLEEISEQNTDIDSIPRSMLLQQAQPAALDLCQ